MTEWLDCGRAEAFKGCWHGGLLLLCAGAALYNGAAFLKRRDAHLAVNALVYGVATIFEYQHVQHHRERV